MANSPVFHVIRDKGPANNASLNLDNGDFVDLFFTTVGGSDLVLEQVADGPDADTFADFDPDTRVVIGSTSYNFSVLLSGTLPTTNNNGAGKIPPILRGQPVIMIKIDLNNDGILDNSDPQYLVVLSGDNTAALDALWGNGAAELGNLDVTPPPEEVCFCAGTEIATPSGPRRVEALVAGDWVTTAKGEARQVMWVGMSRVKRATLAAHPGLRPVTIPADAFGPGAPAADLQVSPQHRVLIAHPACDLLFGESQVLVPAKFLLGMFGEVADPLADVDYVHVLLADHDMLISNGLATESFQPARRTLDVMAPDARAMLEQVIATLGEDDLLTRKDSYLSLRQAEAAVLLQAMASPRKSVLVSEPSGAALH